jgi:hypothetical protein
VKGVVSYVNYLLSFISFLRQSLSFLVYIFIFEGGLSMGHDISGYNKAGEEIAYARFSMGNYNATILYSLLDANEYYAGVSGSGGSSTFSTQQIEKALNAYKELYNNGDPLPESVLTWDQKQIQNFILNCFATAQKEDSVRVYFG